MSRHPSLPPETPSDQCPPFTPEVIALVCSQGHQGWMGSHLVHHEADWLELALNWRADLCDQSGGVAPGTIFGLLDSALGCALWQARGLIGRQVTVELRSDFVRPARPGSGIVARGSLVGAQGNLAFLRAVAYDGDFADPVAQAAATFMIMPQTAR